MSCAAHSMSNQIDQIDSLSVFKLFNSWCTFRSLLEVFAINDLFSSKHNYKISYKFPCIIIVLVFYDDVEFNE